MRDFTLTVFRTRRPALSHLTRDVLAVGAAV
jgi:hypothetical protein